MIEEEQQQLHGARRKQSPRRWIAYQKRKWRVKAAQRKKRRLDAAKARDSEEPTQQGPSALSIYGILPYPVALLRQHVQAAAKVFMSVRSF